MRETEPYYHDSIAVGGFVKSFQVFPCEGTLNPQDICWRLYCEGCELSKFEPDIIGESTRIASLASWVLDFAHGDPDKDVARVVSTGARPQ